MGKQDAFSRHESAPKNKEDYKPPAMVEKPVEDRKEERLPPLYEQPKQRMTPTVRKYPCGFKSCDRYFVNNQAKNVHAYWTHGVPFPPKKAIPLPQEIPKT